MAAWRSNLLLSQSSVNPLESGIDYLAFPGKARIVALSSSGCTFFDTCNPQPKPLREKDISACTDTLCLDFV
jgi:hypothetical protein